MPNTIIDTVHQKLKILLADDNPLNMLLATRLLENRGYHVFSAMNGKEVLEILNRESVDLVFMDIQMPIMDGIEATVEIRKKKSVRDLPIIAMTAYSMEEDKEAFIDAGMNDYVIKPIRPDSLYEIIDRFFPNG